MTVAFMCVWLFMFAWFGVVLCARSSIVCVCVFRRLSIQVERCRASGEVHMVHWCDMPFDASNVLPRCWGALFVG